MVSLHEKEYYSRHEASNILQISGNNVLLLIKNGTLKLYDDSKNPKRITADSIFSYKVELDERRNLSSAKWLNSHGDY